MSRRSKTKKSYNKSFIRGINIPMPVIKRGHPVLKKNVLLDYTHFSILFSKDRKQPVCTAVNIDGKNFLKIKRKRDKWVFDKTIEEIEQVGKKFYSNTNKDFHKGHIVRRMDPCWGKRQEAGKAETDTFHYTNSSPQHRKFNPTIWLELERNILEKGAVEHKERITVFAGPVLSPADKPFIKKIGAEYVFIPSRFWKIIIWKKSDNTFCAVGFIQSQKNLIGKWINQSYGRKRIRGALDKHFENMKFKDNAVYQVNIDHIEKVTGLAFNLRGIKKPRVKGKIKRLEEGVKSRGATKLHYRGVYRSSGKKKVSIAGLILE